MTNLKSDLSIQDEEGSEMIEWEKKLHNKWDEKFLIKRIGEENIEITLRQRNDILTALNDGARFVQIGKYTLMINSIKSIDPRYEPDNIPPSHPYTYKPEEFKIEKSMKLLDGVYKEIETKVDISKTLNYKKQLFAYNLWNKLQKGNVGTGIVLSKEALELTNKP